MREDESTRATIAGQEHRPEMQQVQYPKPHYDHKIIFPERRTDDSWLLTYLDLITLILVLFIFLLAFAQKGKHEYQAVTQAMSEAVGGGKSFHEGKEIEKGDVLLNLPELPPLPLDQLMEERRTDSLHNLQARLLEKLEQQGIEEDVQIILNEQSVDIQLNEKILFPSGQASFNSAAAIVLQPVIEILKGENNQITVEGHTDNVPISTPAFPSNWELSSSRATNVVRYLIAQGIDPQRVRAVGYADTRPIEDNATPDGRSQNRRVTLVIQQSESTSSPSQP